MDIVNITNEMLDSSMPASFGKDLLRSGFHLYLHVLDLLLVVLRGWESISVFI